MVVGAGRGPLVRASLQVSVSIELNISFSFLYVLLRAE